MNSTLHQLVGNTDIYLLDQIMKGRYLSGDVVLDAGCGEGRNMHWFVQTGIAVYGTDSNAAAIEILQEHYPNLPQNRLRVETVEELSFAPESFDHVISSAVLHFARSEDHFRAMFEAMLRVLKPGGSLLIRMASDIGIEKLVEPVGEGVYNLPDGSSRFLLTRRLLGKMLSTAPVALLEPFKTVNVADIRCMSTLLLEKTSA